MHHSLASRRDLNSWLDVVTDGAKPLSIIPEVRLSFSVSRRVIRVDQRVITEAVPCPGVYALTFVILGVAIGLLVRRPTNPP
jgi:hypothetical protein